MNDNEIETYFLWLTEEEQSDLFNYADRSGVSSLNCESIMEQHESLSSDYEYVDKPITEYPTNETMHPETTNVAPTYSYNQDMISSNLFYNSSDMNQQYQTMNPNAAEFDPMYYPSQSDISPVNPFAVPSTVINSSDVVPSTISYMESNTSSGIEYSNVSSLSNEMEHVPSTPIQNYTVTTEMQSPAVHVDSNDSSEDLHMASVLLNVPLEQLSTEPISGQQELAAESIDFSSVPHDISMIPNDTSSDFHHERLDTLDGDSHITSGYQQTVDSSEYHDDSSRSMVVDEGPPLSESFEIADQMISENGDTSDRSRTEDRTLSPSCLTSEITIDESQPNNTTEEASTVEDEFANRTEEEESTSMAEVDDENCEVDEQVNGTIDDAEDEVLCTEAPVVQICIRTGCVNPAVNNPEWEQEFCSNDCVVIHCRNVFDTWVAANAVLSQ